MRLTFIIVISLLLAVFPGYAGNDLPGWSLKSIGDIDNHPSLVHFSWETQRPPYTNLDKIALHRLVQVENIVLNKKIIFMLPGTWNAGGWSRITDPAVNTMIFLANNGFDVYTLDYRSKNIPDMDNDQFDQYGIDISVTTTWTYGVFRDDIKACVDLIKKLTNGHKIFMSGFSRGTNLLYYYASKYPDDLRGMVVLDYFIKDNPPIGTPLDEATYRMAIDLFKEKLLVDPVSADAVPWLIPPAFYLDDVTYSNWKLAGCLPFARSMVGGPLPADYEEISDYVADSAYHIWDVFGLGEGALSNYDDDQIDREVLITVLNEFNRYYPNIQGLEDTQLQAWDDVPYFDYDDNDIYLPAIAFVTSYIGCPYGSCQFDILPNMTRSSDVTVKWLTGYGHIDVLFGKNSLTDVKQPLLQWLNDHLPAGSASAPVSIRDIEQAAKSIVLQLVSRHL